MKSLSSLGIGFSLVSGFLFMALVAELCYLLWWKKRASRGVEDSNRLLPKEQLFHLLCWRKQSSLASAALNPRVDAAGPRWEEGSKDDAAAESLEAELMRLHGLTGPPRLLFTIREETRDELVEAEGGGGGRSRGKSLSDLFLSSDSPLFVTPVSSPPPPQLASLDRYKHGGFNPLFESSKEEDFIRMWSSPPPKLKFLKDAEEKLQHQKAMEGARQEETAAASSTVVAGKSRDRGHSCSTQVIPLHSSPSSIKPPHDKSSS